MAKQITTDQKPNTTLRNFKFEDDLFYDFEYVAEESSRSTTAEMAEAMKQAVAQYKRLNPHKIQKDGSLPRSKGRIQKMSK